VWANDPDAFAPSIGAEAADPLAVVQERPLLAG